ncbi:MAG: acyl carrier protein [Clostridiales bacterium]|nr:acyl carrier protein [Clostridiales bacterium]
MEKFLDFVADIMEVETSEISMETEYKDFERWDSFMMLTLVMEIEAEFGITIPMESLGNVKTLSDLYEFTK